MQRILILLLIPIATFSQVIKGSDTVLPITQKVAEQYSTKNHIVSVTGGGSGVGISSLIEGSCDIAQSSRKIKYSEIKRMQKASKQFEEKIVAYDAIAVIVNPTNKVSQLTREELEKIFTGKITNWKQVGGEDRKIIVYTRESSSGTYEFFKESVLKYKNFKASALSLPATGAIIQSVKQTKGAIAYVGLAYLNKEVKALKVSYDNKQFVYPSIKTASDKTYPILRPLYYYYEKTNKAKVENFINYLESTKGQEIIKQQGFIPAK